MTMTSDPHAALVEPAPPGPAPQPSVAGDGPAGAGRRFLRGRPQDPSWARPALLALLGATALLYLWGLSVSGWANPFYSAAAQAGSQSWKAWFFGSSDAASSITVDKTPAALWVMAASARIFGVNSWSLLVPQALMGVASVGLVHASVRRWYGVAPGLLAGAVTALTPVAVMMFRFNNPDALLVLLLVGSVYALQRAVETGRTAWMVAVGTLIGFGFLAKMLQALLVVPVFAVVYLVAAPDPLRRRVVQVLAGGAALLAAAGWWVAIVELVPASARPYIGGSQNNSILELVLGYNGLGRLTGNETGSVGGGGAGGSRWGATGLLRMFDPENGGQVSWLIPAALILGAYGLVATWAAPRTDRARAGLLLWGGWLVVTGLVFSFMQGIYHAYYTVALAPAVGAVVGIGATLAWRRRSEPAAVLALAVSLAVTSFWSFHLLARSPSFQPWLGPVVMVTGFGAAALLLFVAFLPARAAAALVAVAVVLGLAGPSAYALQTASVAHTGAIPTAGPAVAGARGGPGGGPGGLGAVGRPGRFPGQGAAARFGGAVGGAGGGAGGLLGGSTPAAALTALLQQDAAGYTWVAAAVGSNNASGYQLATGLPVMPIGGFNGSDPSPTLARFQEYVAAGRIHYFIDGGGLGGGMRQNGGSSASSEISAWVTSTFTGTTVDGVTLYDLTG
jgi:4-amino-4-deoxy-L-arabinose transferase-like glycosyltransferase